jgi:catechol 2,3-dioxygenase-like lactoylglutathione lyase family enzyme
MRLTHVRLLVSDPDTCLRFYREVLGFELIMGGPGQVYSEIKAGDGIILAFYQRQMMAEVAGTTELPVDANAQDRVVYTFAVDNVDATYQRLREHGVEFVAPPQDRPAWFLRTAHFRDPEGNLIEINGQMQAS